VTEKDDRLFAPFPIEMDEHPKIIGLSDAAFRAIFEATFYSRRMLSDGFLDERVVLKRWGRGVADELSSNDLERPSWIRVESPKPGWRIHDFEKHHPLKAEIDAKRAGVSRIRSEAGSKGAAKRWQSDSKPVANDSTETETETERKTNSSSTKKSGARRKPETSLPADWIPKPAHVQLANERGVDGRHEEAQFRAHAEANDRRQRDWDAAFRVWLGNARPQRERRLTPEERARQTLALAHDLKELQ
jgi:hypothetical protein